ncbi:hypothetical protein FOZ61_001383 [Perkinsus olseni]|uniref:Uncharacterized protein n=1 Tax=Perkinsus olseni TaxID=32597 RepID=A0A7J6KTU8_PEROL|nr:hypothetical protein FOZ61_001383 [Perkinsus olseni]KAF4649971.1 hypothetical protein FOL46_001312 [Perkinsus olseni]
MRRLRKLGNPHDILLVMLGFGQFRPYGQAAGLRLATPSGKVVYSFGAFCSKWDIKKVSLDDWNESHWIKVMNCVQMAHLSSPLTMMLLSYVAPERVGVIIQEAALSQASKLTAWRTILIRDTVDPAAQERMKKEVGDGMKDCNTTFDQVRKKIASEFKPHDTSDLLRRWCILTPRPKQHWSSFFVHEHLLHSQIEGVELSGAAWKIRRDKVIYCLGRDQRCSTLSRCESLMYSLCNPAHVIRNRYRLIHG